MYDFLSNLFDTSDWPPRWECGAWSEPHGWLHILSDLGVWSAYVAIPLVIGYFLLRRRDVPFRTVFWLFGVFIFACGTTHLMEALIFWWPVYRLAGVIKLSTAVVSWVTVMALVPVTPRALAMRSPEELEQSVRERTAELARLNAALEAEIEQRRHAEAEARAGQERFHRFMQHLPGLAWIKDEAGRYVFANDATLRAFSVPSDRLYGHPDDEVFPPETAKQFKQNDRRARGSEAGVQVIETLRHDDGIVHHSIVSKFPIPGIDDKPPLVGGMAIDITERLQLEEELKCRVDEMARAEKSKDEFLALLAHELRNPLAPIRNGLQLLQVAGHDRHIQEQARSIMARQVEQMVRLIDDLLDVSRITRGKLELREEWVELASVVNSAVEISKPHIEATGNRLMVTLPGSPLLLKADPTRLAQVFSNLLNNSAKYTEKGEIHLSVQADNGLALVRVRDTGIGIPADKLDEIFEMFTQVDRSLERARGGLGIGLTLAKRLVEMHGGSILVASAGSGHGSEFTVRLPLAAPPEAAAAVAAVEAVTPLAAQRILVVDDNVDAAQSLTMLLRMYGHEVRTVHDGESALAEAERFRPRVVFLDLGLPLLNGYEVARRLREADWSRDLLLVAVTGWGQDDDREKSRAAGIDHHFVKPVDLRDLDKLLARLIE
ncbi:MAG: ATP-binding protein [Gemmataceae bacterium]